MPAPAPPPPVETPPPPSPSSQAGDEYHTPPPSLDASPREAPGFLRDGRGGARGAGASRSPPLHASPPREEAGLLPSDGRGEAGAPAKSPQLSPVRLPTPHLLPPPASPSSGQNGQEAAAAPARPHLRLATGLVRTPSQGSLATKSPSPSQGPIAVPPFDRAEEAATSPLRLGKAHLDHHQQQQHQHQHAASAAAENGGAMPPDGAAVAAVGDRRALSVTLRLATAVLSLAAFSVIASARTSGWAGDSYARHQQYRSVIATCSHVSSRPGFLLPVSSDVSGF